VNTLAPGPIANTEGMSRLAPGELAEKSKKGIPMGRWGEIDEIAEVCLFMCSPAASYITGTSLLVDGGTALVGSGSFMGMMG
jgi:peroxisomal 2,4-dienoyl-CoA reductase